MAGPQDDLATLRILLNLPPECPFHPRCPHAMDICRAEFPAQRELGPRRQVSCHLYSEDAS